MDKFVKLAVRAVSLSSGLTSVFMGSLDVRAALCHNTHRNHLHLEITAQ